MADKPIVAPRVNVGVETTDSQDNRQWESAAPKPSKTTRALSTLVK